MGTMILITGGCRSGKSSYALKRAEALDRERVFIATCRPDDAEMTQRIARHQAERSAAWRTIEDYGSLIGTLETETRRGATLVIDCLTLYVSNLLLANEPSDAVISNVRELTAIIARGEATAIIVSNEVGWGIVPDNALARAFRDIAGTANRVIAESADEVYCMIAGIPIKIK